MIMVNVFNVYYSKIKFHNIIYVHTHHIYAYIYIFIKYVYMCVYACIHVFYLNGIPFLPFNSKVMVEGLRKPSML